MDPQPPPASRESGSRRFEFRECLGRGGFGEVYRALMHSPGGLHTDVAVKILRQADADAVRRLRDEGRLLASLRHPTILRVHDLAVLDGSVALVTEYVEGADLAECFGPGGLSPRALLEVVGAVADALHAARSTPPPDGGRALDLVHRDIKPSNIRLGRHGEVKLLDFGIAWSQTPDREAHTRGGSTVGSLPYMAPERFGRAPAIAASDVYALGCTLFEGLVGDRLYPDAIPVEMYQRAASRDLHDTFIAERTAELERRLEPRIAELLRAMLSFVAANRPSAEDVARQCEHLVEDLPGQRLRAWVRERAWSSASPLWGGLTGRVVSEQLATSSERVPTSPMAVPEAPGSADTIHVPDLPPPAEDSASGATSAFETWDERSAGASPPASAGPPKPAGDDSPGAGTPAPPRWAAPLAIGAGLVVMLVVGGILAVVIAGGALTNAPVAAQTTTSPPAPRSSAEPSPPSAPPPSPSTPPLATTTAPPLAPPAPASVQAARAERVPSPPPSSVTPSATVASPPTPSPPVALPVAPEPPPAAAAAPGTVRVIGEVRVELARDGQRFRPGAVPAGLYEVFADFYGEMSPAGRVEVPPGGAVAIRCNALKATCEVER